MPQNQVSGGGAGASFSDVIGHEDLIKELRAAIEDGHLSHAYLLEGMEGSGRRTLANAFAAELMGTEEDRRLLEHGNHPDIKHIRPENGRQGISVEQIRSQLVDDMNIRPYRSSHKVYIVEDADKLTEAAQNAALKTIEEPPAYGIVMLLCRHASQMLPTIVSRTVLLRLEPLGTQEIENELIRRGVSPDLAQEAAVFSQGSLGMALKLSQDQDFRSLEHDVFTFLARMPHLGAADIVSGISLFDDYKDDTDRILQLMLLWQRDVCVYAATGDESRIVLSRHKPDIIACAASRPAGTQQKIAETIAQASSQLSHNVQRDLVLTVLLSRYTQTEKNKS